MLPIRWWKDKENWAMQKNAVLSIHYDHVVASSRRKVESRHWDERRYASERAKILAALAVYPALAGYAVKWVWGFHGFDAGIRR